MRRALLARLERLETMPVGSRAAFFRYGWLQRLPADYAGERHIATLSHQPTINPLVEWCLFEERPGPGPAIDVSEGMTVFLTEPPPAREERTGDH